MGTKEDEGESEAEEAEAEGEESESEGEGEEGEGESEEPEGESEEPEDEGEEPESEGEEPEGEGEEAEDEPDSEEPEDVGSGTGTGTGTGTAAPGGAGMRVDPLGLSALLTYVLIGGFLVFGFAWAIFPAVEAQNASPCRPLRPEDRSGPAPAFHVQDLQGNAVSLESFEGKFVVLNFWATWCEPCISEWPQVHRLAERLAGDEDIVVVALSIDNERDAILPFLERMAMAKNVAPDGAEPQYELTTDVMVLWDPKQEVHKTFGTEKIPDTYFLDEAGQLVHAFINVRSWGSPDALHCVDSLAGS